MRFTRTADESARKSRLANAASSGASPPAPAQDGGGLSFPVTTKSGALAERGQPSVGSPAPKEQAVAREREQVAHLAKILYARKGELEEILKAQLKERDELVLGGVTRTMLASMTVPVLMSH